MAICGAIGNYYIQEGRSQKATESEKRIIDNQNKGFENIDSKLTEQEAETPMINGVVQTGVRKVGNPKSFVRKTERPDSSKKRQESWQKFKTQNKLEHHAIPFKIYNHGKYPVTDISFKVIYDKPVFIVGDGANNVPITDVRNFPAYHPLDETAKDEYSFLPIEWIGTMFIYDDFRLSELSPNESVSFEVQRITDKLFLRKPTIEIRFKDYKGNKWLKLNDDYSRIE